MPFNPVNVFMFKNELRYYLLLPVLEISTSLGIKHDRLFSILVTFYLIGAAYLVTRLTINHQKKADQFWPLFNFNVSFFILLSLFMNGRLASAFAGIILIQLALQSKFTNQIHTSLFFPLVLVGLWLCSVSSGVFLVANLTLYFGIALYLLDTFKKKGITREGVFLTVLYLFILNFLLLILLVDINSELFYYNYNLFEMLQHGSGIIFWSLGTLGVVVLFILMGLGGFIFHYMWNRFPKLRMHFLPIPFSLALGLFGYSTLLAGLPATLSLANILFLNFRDNKIKGSRLSSLPTPTEG